MITQTELARRLRIARTSVEISQETVAAELGVPRPTISQIEAGKRGVSSIELAKLAKLYSRPMASFFEGEFGGTVDSAALTVLFRATELVPEDGHVVEEFEDVCRAYADLEELLGLKGEATVPDYSGISEPRNRLEAIKHGERIAVQERHRLGIGDDPIRDIFALLENQGVRLFVRPLHTNNISGLFLYDESIGPCILINGAEHRNRLAFNAAHEYAHVLFDRRLRAHVSAASRYLDDSDERGQLLEVRANSLAAALLLPAAGIERFLLHRGKTRRNRHAIDVLDVLYLHRAFGVSYQAALYRLQNLGWLSREQREALAGYRPEVLARAVGFPDERREDEGSVQGHYPLRYVFLALEAYRQAKISLGKVAELLGQHPAQVRELVWDLGVKPEVAPVSEAA